MFRQLKHIVKRTKLKLQPRNKQKKHAENNIGPISMLLKLIIHCLLVINCKEVRKDVQNHSKEYNFIA